MPNHRWHTAGDPRMINAIAVAKLEVGLRYPRAPERRKAGERGEITE